MSTQTALSKLAKKYDSNKNTYFYYNLLISKRLSINKVLEIGIGDGSSLRMWHDFFPNAQIYGADYRKETLIESDRITSILCDQRREDHLRHVINTIGPDIDLVIDDGSNRTRDQIFTCKKLMPILNKDVIYVIENVTDTHIVNMFAGCDAILHSLSSTDNKTKDTVVVRLKKQIDITFFAKPAFLDINPSRPFIYDGKAPTRGWLKRISSITRGEQIATYINAKLNPTEGYQNDICIYVKPPYKPGYDFLFEGRTAYLDICDAPGFFDLLKKYPKVRVISASDRTFETLKRLLPNKVVNIPEQHCNFERQRRTREQITTVGCIGNPRAFSFLPAGLKQELSKRNVQLLEFSSIFTRQDVINYYMNIDVQIIWRPYIDAQKGRLMNPLKIINASSFGIPTIMYEEKHALEMEGCYIAVHSLNEFLSELDKLRFNSELYDEYTKRCIEKSEKYHIEHIAQLYKNLAFE